MKKGLVHIYTGHGKGKTTAAMGLCLRALGCGLTVKVYRFLKSAPSGELSALKQFPRASVFCANGLSKFTWEMTAEERALFVDGQLTLFEEAAEAACSNENDLVILDEVMGLIREGVIGDRQLAYIIERKSKSVELILTGRDAPESLYPLADYITEMSAVKHPYSRGTHARRGIEY